MLDFDDGPGAGIGIGAGGRAKVTSLSVLPSSVWEEFENTLIARTISGSADIAVTQTSSIERPNAVTLTLPNGEDHTFGVRGGEEPGVFMLIEGLSLRQSNPGHRDQFCLGQQASGHGEIFSVNTYTLPQGARTKFGGYAQFGELALTSAPGVCDGLVELTQSVFDIKEEVYRLFHARHEIEVEMDGQPIPATTTTGVHRFWITDGYYFPDEGMAKFFYKTPGMDDFHYVHGEPGRGLDFSTPGEYSFIIVSNRRGIANFTITAE